MEELNKKLKQLNNEYKEHNEFKKTNNIFNVENVNYKKLLEKNIKETEKTSNKFNSFLTDSTIYEQPNKFYNNKKDENLCFSNDKDVEDMNNNNNEKMSSLLFTNYKKEVKKDDLIYNAQKGYIDGNMILPINTQESNTKNGKYKNKTINNSRMSNYQPIGRSMNMRFDNKLEINKSKVYKDVANKRLNELNRMASVNPYPINYENRVSTMTKEYFNYDSQTEKELNTYYKKNNNNN